MEWGALVHSDTAWWVLGFTSMWQQTDLALCSFYDGNGHLWKILVLSPSVLPVVSQHFVFSLLKEKPSIQAGTEFHKDCDLAIISKKTWKAEQRHQAWSLCLWGAVSDSSVVGVQDGTLRDEWLAKRSAGGDYRAPQLIQCPALHAAHPPGTQHLWNRKAPRARLSLPCECAARIPQKHKALRNPGLCQCMGEKNAGMWNGRRGVCLEKQTERLGSFQEAVPGLLMYSPGCQIVLQKSGCSRSC